MKLTELINKFWRKLMKNLRLFYIYTNFNRDIYILPIEFDEECSWYTCKLFSFNKDKGEVHDLGYKYYKKDGTCTFFTNYTANYNAKVIVALSILHPKLQKAIKNYKAFIKKELKHGSK